MPEAPILKLKSKLDPRLVACGFAAEELTGECQCYRAKLGDGVSAKFVLALTHEGSSVIPYMQIASERIEQIMNRLLPKRESRGGTAWTLNAEIGKVMFQQRRLWEFWIYSSGAIQPLGNTERAATRLEALFDKYALRFYSAFSTLSAIEAALNDDPGELSFYCGIWPKRIAQGLIAAKLVRPDRFENLIEVYETVVELKLSSAQTRQFNYSKFVDDLNALTLS